MRIGLTVDSLNPVLTGIGRYTWELSQRLAFQSEIESLSYFRFDRWIRKPENYVRVPVPKALYLPRWLKREIAQGNFQNRLVHGTNYFLPRQVERGVLTVHDLSIYRHPETHPPQRIADFEKGFQHSLSRSAHVITDSETVRMELIADRNLRPQDVTAIHLGVSDQFRPMTPAERLPVLRRLLGDHAENYILSVATFEPRKRIEQAILANTAYGSNTPLVLVGAAGWQNEGLHALIDKQTSAGNLIMLGHVAESDLPYLYAGARLFLYPSIYEGFGLPPIEAMASGVPAIVSDRSCLPEVTQEAAMLVDPDDLDAFRDAIQRGLEDDNWRREAIDRGKRVAAGYTWEKCVEKTVGVYRKVWSGRAL